MEFWKEGGGGGVWSLIFPISVPGLVVACQWEVNTTATHFMAEIFLHQSGETFPTAKQLQDAGLSKSGGVNSLVAMEEEEERRLDEEEDDEESCSGTIPLRPT